MNGLELILTVVSNLHLLIAVFVMSMVQIIKMTGLIKKKYLPLAAVLIGVAGGFGLALWGHLDLIQGTGIGFISGAIASGVYDAVITTKGLFGSLVAKILGREDGK
ncbi:hypothetical protein [Carnobacterium maltaromaticum]|uniref:hypothetical protein n=1 Tax=Carnobacterium maltaromaticum TaxID=2751 RepID=UPI0039BDC92F